jgi:hypothetical protein
MGGGSGLSLVGAPSLEANCSRPKQKGQHHGLPRNLVGCELALVPMDSKTMVGFELELILSHMTQKPMLRGEVGARALRVRSDVRGHGQARLCKALGCGLPEATLDGKV